MWKKQFRSKPTMEYRKRYKCPKCKDYSLYAIHDKACECENDCDVDDVETNKIMKKNDFKGYFTSEEIKNNFFVDDELNNKAFKDILVDRRPYVIERKQIDKLHEFTEKTHNIDEHLDDLMSRYLNRYEMKEDNINDFGYIISLIEDINYFIDCCHKDIILMNYGIEYANMHFRSGRFYYNNAVDHLFLANERIYTLMGIVYEYRFSSNLMQNSTYKINKYLQNCDKVNNIVIHKFMEETDIDFEELREIRGSNTHGLSYYSKEIVEDIRKNGAENYKFWDRDGNEVDKDLLVPKVYQITNYLEKLYDVLNELICAVGNKLELYNKNTIPMINKFLKIDPLNKPKKLYDIPDFEALSLKKIEILRKALIKDNKIVLDIFFRLEEALHCVVDVYNINSGTYFKEWHKAGISEIEGLVNIQYFLYSGALRSHACYDKIADYIKNEYNCEDIQYFSSFRKVSVKESNLNNKIQTILDSEDYKLLNKLRNCIFHNLRCGCLYGDSGLEYYNAVIFKALFENLKIQYDMVDYLLDI